MQSINITGNTVKASTIPHLNLTQGCVVCSLDSDPTNEDEYIFIPLDFEGNPTRAIDVGYTEVFTHTFKENEFSNLDGELNLPGLGYLSFQEIKNHPDLGKLLFYKNIDDNRIEEIDVRDETPTGKCYNDIARYYKLVQYALKDSDGEYLRDSNNEYLIPKEAWT